MTQGDPVSPIVFNIIVSATLRALMLEVCSPWEAQHGLGSEVLKKNFVFYADNGSIAEETTYGYKKTLTALVRRFDRVFMKTNLVSTMVVVCTHGFIW